ncbi:MAG: hypothetical protein R6U63_15535 [Longimicrobiales bacterium]
MSDDAAGPRITEEQRIYANILNVGMYAGLGLLLIGFVLYVTGLMEPVVPIDDLPLYWDLSVGEYLDVVNERYLHRDHHLTGWWWLSAVGHGDYLNFIGIAVLSGVTIVCFLGIIPTLFRKGDYIYAAIAIVEVAVLVAAASGLLAVGH